MAPYLSCYMFCRLKSIKPAEEALRGRSRGEGGGGQSVQSRAVHLVGLSFKGIFIVDVLWRYMF